MLGEYGCCTSYGDDKRTFAGIAESNLSANKSKDEYSWCPNADREITARYRCFPLSSQLGVKAMVLLQEFIKSLSQN
ncbi:hypothetical protein LSM04_003492 [Trypanosoma melophagium]|uniref:uncharacterized protein n=1 Tax=Trypanosoma melophagium TaxID=715481 RepID=UPI00351A0964|nr:hypothetical protein LSM04_003492 [Trypanosoma melophagium]